MIEVDKNCSYYKDIIKDEIIIDGVNVAGCKHYRGKYFSDNEYKDCALYENKGFCEELNCYYKQLQRLKQENEELKKEIQSQKGLITVGGKQQYQVIIAYDKLRSALEEIKNILQENCNQCFEIDNFTKPDDCGICEWARILKVINEVLNDSNT